MTLRNHGQSAQVVKGYFHPFSYPVVIFSPVIAKVLGLDR